MKWYGIKLNGKPLGFQTSSVDNPEFSVSVEFELNSYSDNVWLVPHYGVALKVMNTNTAWYNADYDSPKNPYLYQDLEIFEIEI